jgi:hypothetical protein
MSLFGSSEERLARAAAKEERRATVQAWEAKVDDLERRISETHEHVDSIKNDECAAASDKWEYTVRDDLEEATLNRYGLRGWLLVNALSYTTGFGLGGNERHTVHTRYVFRRKLLERYSDSVEGLWSEIESLREDLRHARYSLDQARQAEF